MSEIIDTEDGFELDKVPEVLNYEPEELQDKIEEVTQSESISELEIEESDDFDDFSDLDSLENDNWEAGFFGPSDFDLDDVTVVPNDNIVKSSKRPDIANAISMALADRPTIRQHLEELGIDDAKLEQIAETGDARYVLSLISALEVTLNPNDTMSEITRRPGSIWDVAVDYEGMPLTANRKKATFGKGNLNNVSGNEALQLYDSFTSSGNTIEIPLWHSGIWIHVKRPTLSASLELDTKIATEKATMGRGTRGASYSNDSFYISKHVLDFAMNNMTYHTVKGASKEEVRGLIDHRDLDTIAWGLALAEYPTGFPFEQTCMANPDKCSHRTTEIINLGKVHRPDVSRFTEYHRKHMAGRNTRRTVDELDKYRKATVYGKRVNKITDNITVVLKNPTVQEHLTSGFAWAAEIEAATQTSLGLTISDGMRQDYDQAQALATRLRNYAHWIDKIVMTTEDGESSSTVSDEDSIYQLLNRMSSERKERNKVLTAIDEFIVENILVIIGTPNYACQSCGSWAMSSKGPETVIIPWDAMSVFFSLQQFKLTTNMRD